MIYLATIRYPFKISLCLLLSFPLFCGIAVAQGSLDLFHPIAKVNASLDAQQHRILQSVEERPYAAEVRLAHAQNPADLLYATSLTLDVFSDRHVTATVEKVKTRKESFTWIGHLSGRLTGETGQVLLVVDGSDVTGRVRIGRAVYTVEPLGGGLHAIARIDPGKLLGCATTGEAIDSQGGPDGAMEGAVQQNGNPMTNSSHRFWQFTVLVAYTPAAASESGNIGSVIQAAVDLMNESFSNSSMIADITLVHEMQVSYAETGSFSTDLYRLQGRNDGYMDEVHDMRTQHEADVVVLLVDENHPDFGGMADEIGAEAEDGFALVEWDLVISDFVFAHEIGHLAGGRHNNDSGDDPFSYGHGYHTSYWQTIMAVPPYLGFPRMNYWSNPDVPHPQSGDPMGTTGFADMARVWGERVGEISDFLPYHLYVSISGPLQLLEGESNTWDASPSGAGYDYNWYYRYHGGYHDGYWYGMCAGAASSCTYAFFIPTRDTYVDIRVDVDKPGYEGSGMITGWITDPDYDDGDDDCDYGPVTNDPPVPCPNNALVAVQSLPEEFALEGNAPNPFSRQTTIHFALPEAVQVELVVFDMMGRKVATLVDEPVDSGFHEVPFEAQGLPSGVYLYRFRAGDAFAETGRMVVVR